MKDIKFAIAVLEADLDKREKALRDALHTSRQIEGLKEDIKCLKSAIRKMNMIWESY